MQLIETIQLLSDRVEPARDKLAPGDAHICLRNMWFKHRNVKQVPFDARSDSFKKAINAELINWIKACGYAVAEVKGHTIIKDTDGNFALLVIDAMSHARFRSTMKDGPAPDIEHQIMISLKNSGQLSSRGNTLDKCLLLVVNRNDFDLCPIWVEYGEEKAVLIQSFIDDAQSSEEIPPKNEATHCNWCQYKAFCDGNEIASINCRTCANVSLADGEFHCPHGSAPCEKHIYHPQLMECAGHTVKGADPARMIVDYGDFANTPEGVSLPDKANFTSRELYKAAGKHNWHKDEKLLELMRIFDGRLEECN